MYKEYLKQIVDDINEKREKETKVVVGPFDEYIDVTESNKKTASVAA